MLLSVVLNIHIDPPQTRTLCNPLVVLADATLASDLYTSLWYMNCLIDAAVRTPRMSCSSIKTGLNVLIILCSASGSSVFSKPAATLAYVELRLIYLCTYSTSSIG